MLSLCSRLLRGEKKEEVEAEEAIKTMDTRTTKNNLIHPNPSSSSALSSNLREVKDNGITSKLSREATKQNLKKYLPKNDVSLIQTLVDRLCAELPSKLTYTLRHLKRRNIIDLPDAEAIYGLLLKVIRIES